MQKGTVVMCLELVQLVFVRQRNDSANANENERTTAKIVGLFSLLISRFSFFFIKIGKVKFKNEMTISNFGRRYKKVYLRIISGILSINCPCECSTVVK